MFVGKMTNPPMLKRLTKCCTNTICALFTSFSPYVIRQEKRLFRRQFLKTKTILNTLTNWRGPELEMCELEKKYNKFAVYKTVLATDYLEIKVGKQRMKFNYIWLRDHCRCPLCFNETSFQRKIDPVNIDPNIYPDSVTAAEDGTKVSITWPDGHVTSYSLEWLSQVYTMSTQQKEDKHRLFWDREMLESSLPPDVSFEEYMESEQGVTQLLRNLHRFGIAFLSGVPKTRDVTRLIGERVAPLKRTIFGDVDYFPASQQDLIDESYGNAALPSHTDYAHHEDPPGYCLLHYLQQSKDGGETFFSDALRAARILRETHPEHYTALSTLPVAFHKIEKGIFMRCVSTTFGVRGPNQDPEIIRAPNNDRSLLALSHYDAKRWYAAWRQFRDITDDQKNIYYLKGTPGRPLFFDNWRLLHGRLAFEGTRELDSFNWSRDRICNRLRIAVGIDDDVIV